MALTPELASAALELINREGKAPSEADLARGAVIDTNIVLDLLWWHDPHGEALLEAVRSGELVSLAGRETLVELADVLTRTNFMGEEAPEKVLATLGEWISLSRVLPDEALEAAARGIHVQCRDPLDQKFLVVAFAAKAPLLLSKDKLVLKAGRRLGRTGTKAMSLLDWNRQREKASA